MAEENFQRWHHTQHFSGELLAYQSQTHPFTDLSWATISQRARRGIEMDRAFIALFWFRVSVGEMSMELNGVEKQKEGSHS